MVLLQNTNLRQLCIDDFEKLKMFHVKHFQNYKISDESFIAYLSQPQYQTFGMFHVKHLIGYVIFLASKSEADIVYIAVHPDYRRQGVATALLNSIDKDLDDYRIFLEVSVENLGAIAFYKSQGFQIDAVRPKYLDGKDSYLMVKKF